MKFMSAVWAGVALAAASARGSADVTIMDIEDRVYQARDLDITKEGSDLILNFTDQNGQKHRMNCQDLVEMGFKGLQPLAKFGVSDVRVVFTNGDVLFGKLSKTAGTAFELVTALLGTVKIDFGHVQRVEFLANHEFLQPAPDTKGFDLIQFKNKGNFDLGTVSDLSAAAVKYKDKDDQPFEMSVGDVTAVQFTQTQKPPEEPSTLYSLLTLTDESTLRGRIEKIEGTVLHFTTLYGASHNILTGSISSLHFRNGRVVYLSDLAPSLVDENANFIRTDKSRESDLVYPFQRDRNVKGGKMVIRGTEFKKGIGVHTRSILEFKLDGQYDKFLAVLGIDDIGCEHGSVVFEIQVDGKKSMEPISRTRQSDPQSVSIPVQGAKTLRLIAYFGEAGNTGGTADWAMARLIRK